MKIKKDVKYGCEHCNGKGFTMGYNNLVLRKIRESKDISLREAARNMGISAAYLSDIELGRRAVSEKVITFLNSL